MYMSPSHPRLGTDHLVVRLLDLGCKPPSLGLQSLIPILITNPINSLSSQNLSCLLSHTFHQGLQPGCFDVRASRAAGELSQGPA